MRELKELSLLIKEWDIHRDISKMSDESVCKFLVVQKSISDLLEILSPVFRSAFLNRGIGVYMNEELGLQVTTEKENNSTEINIENLFFDIDTAEFLKLVSVVKSKAITPVQKSAIERHSVVIEKTGKVVKVGKLTKKLQKELVSK